MKLSHGEVHVYYCTTGETRSDGAFFASLLSVDERERASRFSFEKDRRSFEITRGTLRLILAQYLDQEPGSISIEAEAKGKPRLGQPCVNPDLRFNVSHCGGVSAFAVAVAVEVGIDIESINRDVSYRDAIAARFFSPLENDKLATFPGDEKNAAFLRCWTRKEAYIKGLGGGFSISLSKFSVSLNDCSPTMVFSAGEPGPPAPWYIHDVGVPVGYTAALAVDLVEAKIVEQGEYTGPKKQRLELTQ